MNVIVAKLNKNTSYIFHLLSVSQCGYDNVYGEINSKYHPIEDLKILKQYESYITVRGGKHSGELYGMLVCIPAALEDDKAFTEYINALIDLFGKENLDSNYDLYEDIYKTAYASLNVTVSKASTMEFYNNFKKIKEPIVSICEVLKKNYQVFNNEIWPSTMENLELYVSKLNDIIGKSEIKLEWERKLSHSYPFDKFFALIVNSIENGVQAIDISLNKDVFYSNADLQDTIHLISHEFGIYILKDVLKDTNAFMNFSNYDILEALAEFFNPVENPNSHFLKNESHYFKFFKQLINENHKISIKELFLIASKKSRS